MLKDNPLKGGFREDAKSKGTSKCRRGSTFKHLRRVGGGSRGGTSREPVKTLRPDFWGQVTQKGEMASAVDFKEREIGTFAEWMG